MRYLLLVVFLTFASAWVFGQEKNCPFCRDSIIKPDRVQTKQLVKQIAAMQLTPYHEVDKIPAFIKEAFICWNNEWKIVNPEPETAHIKIDSVLSFGRRTRNPDDSVLALASATAISISGSKKAFKPDRQLMYLGLNEQYMLIAYIGDSNCWQYYPVILFRFENKKIISVMYWRGSSEEVKTKEEVLKSLRSLEPSFLIPYM
jgi:hypothetical protein